MPHLTGNHFKLLIHMVLAARRWTDDVRSILSFVPKRSLSITFYSILWKTSTMVTIDVVNFDILTPMCYYQCKFGSYKLIGPGKVSPLLLDAFPGHTPSVGRM